MVITVKNFELRNIAEALSKIDTKNLKVSTGFKVAKLVKTFSEALTEFSEASTEIQKEYVKKAIGEQLGSKFKAKPELEALNYKALERGIALT